ncbi:hypothetical protein BGX26_004851 [Mortierella sp. AD094]|nr:hypothetical protein BGX26_004851 [Mortierella sp. AD094]
MSTPAESISGIQDKGDVRVIPMTRRADGTFRKERKVRPGYTPPEDVAKYTNRVLDAIRPASSVSSLATPPTNNSNSSGTPKTKSQIKNEKRKAKRKEDLPSETDQNKLETEDAARPSTDATSTTTTANTTAAAESAPVDPEKKLRALNKKLRQAEQLKERQEKGEELLPEQLEKISKMDELQALIAELAL